MEPLQLIATATAGLEACVKHELADLGYPDAKVCSPGRILFAGDETALARANLWLRTAERVLLSVGTFEARDFGELFDRTHALPWEQWIPADGAFPVSGRSHKSQLSSVPACQKIVKKAIVEKLRAAHRVSTLPESGPVVPVEVAILEDSVRLTIDTSGPGLHKRGYRAAAGPAPLKETIAAAMIQLSFWRPDRPLIDPFCGSGTIPIEAALIGRNIAPGLNRRFQAEDWPALAPGIWADERARARDLIRPALPMKIIGSDIEEKAASLSAYHAGLAGVADDVEFQIRPFAELRSNDRYGFVLCNPPYGERFNEGLDIQGIYRSMSEVFRRLPTWSFYILTSENLEAVLGQQASRRRKLYNGPIECTFFQFHGPRPGKGEVDPPAAPIVRAGDVKLPPAWQEEADDDLPPAGAPVFGGLKANAAAQAEAFANRLKKTARHLRRWPARGVTCYRLYDRDIPEVPLAVDIYEGRLHLAEYQRPHDRTPAEHANWLDLMAETAGEVLGVTRELTFLKRRERQKGAAQYGKFSQTGYVATVHEGGLAFEVNLSDYLDTGLFLDHRLTREMVRKESAGKRVVNLFGYTGSFSVYAASGQAASTTTVDLSNTYLDWAHRNMAANGFSQGSSADKHRFVRSDAVAFLRDHRPGVCYDLAVIDPPTFSNSKMLTDIFDVQRDYAPLLRAAAALMSPGGVIYFSTNFRRFKLDEMALPGLACQDISQKTIPDDFRNGRIHYCWRIVLG